MPDAFWRSRPEDQAIPRIGVSWICRWVDELVQHFVDDESRELRRQQLAFLLAIAGLAVRLIAKLDLFLG